MAESDTPLPLISVVTPTWQRHKQLLQCIASVAQQIHRPVQHIVVSDGPDDELAELLEPACKFYTSGYELVFDTLPEHDYNIRWGMRARLHGIELAKGDYIAYLDDDNKFRPKHLQTLLDALNGTPDAGFAYSASQFHNADHMPGPIIGTDPPQYCGLDTSSIMHHRSILEKATWHDDGKQATIDWDLTKRWIQAGVGWAFTRRITVDYFKS